MSDYPLIKKWMPKLEIKKNSLFVVATKEVTQDYIDPADLEAELAKGVPAYKWVSTRYPSWSERPCEPDEVPDTHTGLIIGIQELPRKVKREEIEAALHEGSPDTLYELLQRILREGLE